MKKRVTVQDIADTLGLSRNTISKAINGTGNVSPATRDLIFKTASDMGYKQFSMLSAISTEVEKPCANREIALFTCSIPGSQFLSSSLLDSFEEKISSLGYRLIVYLLRADTIAACTLPDNFNANATDAILIMELFDKDYINFLCDSSIPTLFVDSFANPFHENIHSDILFMESVNTSYNLVAHLIESGCTKIGFVGDYTHCQSFYERWTGYQNAMKEHNILDYMDFCITDDDASPYDDISWLSERIRSLSKLPDAFFCANDYIAICIIKTLKHLHYKLPEDIKVAGFDNSNESRIIEPALTTVSIPGTQMGYIATNILLDRINYPDTPYRSTYVQTEVVYRHSTE